MLLYRVPVNVYIIPSLWCYHGCYFQSYWDPGQFPSLKSGPTGVTTTTESSTGINLAGITMVLASYLADYLRAAPVLRLCSLCALCDLHSQKFCEAATNINISFNDLLFLMITSTQRPREPAFHCLRQPAMHGTSVPAQRNGRGQRGQRS